MKEKLLSLLQNIGPDLLRQAATAIESGEHPTALLEQIERDLRAKGAQLLLDEVLNRAGR